MNVEVREQLARVELWELNLGLAQVPLSRDPSHRPLEENVLKSRVTRQNQTKPMTLATVLLLLEAQLLISGNKNLYFLIVFLTVLCGFLVS